MKKWMSFLLLLFTLLVSVPGCAEEAETLNLNQENTYETAASLCFVEDTLYILGNRGIYAYDGNALTLCVDLSDANMYRYNPMRPVDEAQAAAWERAVSRLFTDGTALYGLHPYTGQVFAIEGGEMKAFAQLPQDLLYVSDEDFYREIKNAVYADGRLALLLGTDSYEEYDKTELVLVDLEKQTHTVSAVEYARGIAAGEQGKLLVYVEEEQGASVWQYDMRGDTLESEMVRLEAGAAPGGLQGFGSGAVYLDGSRVKLADGKQAAVKAYMPVQYADVNGPAACSKRGMYAYAYANYVFLRDVSGEGEAQQTVLTVMGYVNPQTVIDFTIQHPDIAVVTRNEADDSALQAAAVSKDAGVDLFVLSAPGSYTAMLQNGYLAPLKSDALMQEAKKLYPAIREVVFSGEQLYGYPMSLVPLCWMANETKWNAFGLGDYPATYTELLEMIELWIQDYAADYPEDTVSELHQAGLSSFVLSIVEAYIYEYEGAEGAFTFDHPSFRETLEKVAEYAHLFDSEDEQWGMAMLNSNYLGFGYAYTDSDLNRMIPRPKLSAESPTAMYAAAEVMAVSAASRQTDAAIRFVEFCAEQLPVQTKYEMSPALNEPVEDERYQARVAEVNAQIEELERQQADTPEKKEAVSSEIAALKNRLANLEENRYTISAESIAVYRSMAEEMKIPYQSAYFGSAGGFDSLSEVVMRFTGDGFEASEIDAMIRELNRVAHMVGAENQS